MIDVTRAQVLAYRAASSGLDRSTDDPAALAVLDLGVQDVRGSWRVALAARLPEPAAADALLADGGPGALGWTVRGAPHVHRRADLPALARALWPLSDEDAFARLPAERKPLAAAGVGGLEAFTAASEAMREVVPGDTPRGEVSAGMTARLPAAYSYDCRSCGTRHVYGGLFQAVGLFAGVRLVPDTVPGVLTPQEGRGPVPADAPGTAGVVRRYLRQHGPATAADAAGYLGTTAARLRPAWPDDLAEVRVESRTAWIPADRVEALRDAPAPPHVRLLPALDPYLQARDRELLVPEKAHRAEVWRILGNPGALLVDGEVAGVWRARSGRTLAVTVTPFGRVPGTARAAVEEEAARLAAVRGKDAAVSWEG